MSKIILISVLLISIVLSEIPPINDFAAWKTQFKRKFQPQEQLFRSIVFQKKLDKIKAHNSNKSQTYTMGVNQFTVLSDQQFQQLYLQGLKLDSKQKISSDSQIVTAKAKPSLTPTTTSIDWTTKGGVTNIKNQGQCGSCWSFSAVAVIQSYNLIFKSIFSDFSEQQLVDCSSSYGNQGCIGGWPSNALKYVRDKGISTESQYPYVAVDQVCKKVGGRFKISTINYASGCTGLQSTILKNPVSVALDATNWSSYSSGVFNNCGTSINHAVLLVGIVSGNWKIKNSWGTGWGQSGYMRLVAGNTCGICNYAGEWAQ